MTHDFLSPLHPRRFGVPAALWDVAQNYAEAYAAERVAQYKQDAERYRWLRIKSTKPYEAWSTLSSPREFDADIDAAIRARAREQQT